MPGFPQEAEDIEADEALSQLAGIIGPGATKGAKILAINANMITLSYNDPQGKVTGDLSPASDDLVDVTEFREVILPYVCGRILEDPMLADNPEIVEAETQVTS